MRIRDKLAKLWVKLKQNLKRWEFHVGVLGLVLTVGIAVAVIFYWENVREFQHYGYLGAFVISIFGGATILAPIPMTPVVFALGTVTRPEFAPHLGPVFIGVAAGLGETIGGLSIYMTGLGGGAAVSGLNYGRILRVYFRLLDWMERRGSLVLFVLSAVLNPFFYPAALAAGALRFGVRKYFLVCWAGKTIKGISVAAAGYWGLGAILRAMGVPI